MTDPSFITDGNMDVTCDITNTTSAWWMVDLLDIHIVDFIYVVGAQLTGQFKISHSMSSIKLHFLQNLKSLKSQIFECSRPGDLHVAYSVR